MENSKRIDLISLTASLIIHVLILTAISVNQVLSGKTYQVVNVVPISFDTEVESDIVGVKSVKGKMKSGVPRTRNSVTVGIRSCRRAGGGGASLKKPKSRGIGQTSETVNFGTSVSRPLNSPTTGKGTATLDLSAELPDRRGKSIPSISSSILVPYLIRVRDTIMKNWKVPYYTSIPEKEKQTTIVLTLKNDGTVDELTVEKLSPDITFNRSAISAIYSVKSFGPFPKGVKEKKVRLKVKFEVK